MTNDQARGSDDAGRRARRPWPLELMAARNRLIYRVTGGRFGSNEAASAAPKGRTLDVISAVHLRLYRWTNGLIGASTAGLPTLLLTTTGRKTGLARTVPLPYFPHGQDVVVVGSFAGGPKNPAWYANLLEKPDVEVQIKGKRYRAIARTAEGEERAAIWASIVRDWKNYSDYERVAPRQIPVVVLREVI